MLYDLIANGFGSGEDYNCAEKILAGANVAYKLGLDEKALKLAAGFGGGMGIESVCGALTGAIMALGVMHVKTVAHESDIKALETDLIARFDAKFGNIDCKPLKVDHRTPERGCSDLIAAAARLFDDFVAENKLAQ